MIIKLSKNIINSFIKFVLFTALIHIGILIIRTIKEGDIKLLNYFGILDLEAFFPNIIKGGISDAISVIIMVAIFLVFLVINLRNKTILRKE